MNQRHYQEQGSLALVVLVLVYAVFCAYMLYWGCFRDCVYINGEWVPRDSTKVLAPDPGNTAQPTAQPTA